MFCNDIILLFHKHKQNKSVNFRLRADFCIIMKPLHFHVEMKTSFPQTTALCYTNFNVIF